MPLGVADELEEAMLGLGLGLGVEEPEGGGEGDEGFADWVARV